MPEPPASLSALHEQHHAALRELLFQTLERLVVVDRVGAIHCFEQFVVELNDGLALEEDLVMPCYRLHGPTQGAGKPEIVDGDHVILRRGIESVLAFVNEPADLRTILEGLPHVYRLIGTLEHHTERERRHVYPLVEEHISATARNSVIDGLRRILGHLVDSGAAR